jgi:hypothetical protein
VADLMQVPWETERCIICLCKPADDQPLSRLTDAHVVPESVGGQLSARFLCDRCNSEMGRVEGQLPRDVALIEVVRALEHRLPSELARGILQHAGWFADTKDYGRLEGRESRGADFALRESESIRTDENVRRQIRAELRRRGVLEEAVDGKVAEFEQAADSADLEIAPGFTIRKHIDLSGVSFERTYDEPLAPQAIMLGIGYTFWPSRSKNGSMGTSSSRRGRSFVASSRATPPRPMPGRSNSCAQAHPRRRSTRSP